MEVSGLFTKVFAVIRRHFAPVKVIGGNKHLGGTDRKLCEEVLLALPFCFPADT